jgi:hypothetical protein
MKPKTMFYAALGWATYRAGKVLGKRKLREKLSRSDNAHERDSS